MPETRAQASLLPSEKRTGIVANTKVLKALQAKGGFISWLTDRANYDDSEENNWRIAADQLTSILSAQSLTEMWMADMEFESTGGRDLTNMPMLVQSFSVRRSNKYKHGIPAGDGQRFYIIVTATDLADGKELFWNTGAPLLIGKLVYLELDGLLGKDEAKCVIVSTDTANGAVLKLGPLPTGPVPEPSSDDE